MSLPLLCLAAAMAAPQADLAERLSPLLAEADQTGAWVGAMVMDADGRVLFSQGGSRLMIPASNQKVLTCAFALGVLGPDFRFQTRIWRTQEGAIIDAPGDPTLTRDDLVAAAKTLALPEGSVIRVRSAFRPGTPPSWEWDDLPWYYAPVIQALSYDRAAFEPKAAQGAVTPLPAELGVTVARGPASGRLRAEFSRWTSEITVSGAIGDPEVSLGRMAIPNPDISAIRLLGGIPGPFSGDLPSGPPTVTLTSKPLREIAQECLEPSDNLIAEHLMLAAAAALAPLAPGEEYSQAAAAMTDFFIREGVMSAGEMRPRDGSGLSRQNLATPASILKAHRWAEMRFGSLWTNALAAPGEGTLRTRLKGTPFAGKTGTINAVSTLSGVVSTAKPGAPKYVCLFFNNALLAAQTLRQVQDAFIVECAKDEATLDGQKISSPSSAESNAHPRPRRSDGDWLY